jgi:hypothetical protein
MEGLIKDCGDYLEVDFNKHVQNIQQHTKKVGMLNDKIEKLERLLIAQINIFFFYKNASIQFDDSTNDSIIGLQYYKDSNMKYYRETISAIESKIQRYKDIRDKSYFDYDIYRKQFNDNLKII